MSLVVARIIDDHICIVSETKLTPPECEDIRLHQDPLNGTIKTVIINSYRAISIAGNMYYAEKALQEVDSDLTDEEILGILFFYHSLSEMKTEFIFCFIDAGAKINVIKNGIVENSTSAWIGDYFAFQYFQRFYNKDETLYEEVIANKQDSVKDDNKEKGQMEMSQFRLTIQTSMFTDFFNRMASAMDDLLYYRPLQTIGGFRVLVTFHEGIFSYQRYSVVCREYMPTSKEKVTHFSWSNPQEGSYLVNFAQGRTNYKYAALHILQANLGILYIRTVNGLMKPRLYKMNHVEFSDLISQFDLLLLVANINRVAEYYQKAKRFFAIGQFQESVRWLVRAINFQNHPKDPHLFYMLGISFFNWGRFCSAQICFEQIRSMDKRYKLIVDKILSNPPYSKP